MDNYLNNLLLKNQSHPNYWFSHSSNLWASSRALWDRMYPNNDGEPVSNSGFSMEVACTPVYYMLCGLALETIIKALLAQSGRWGINDSSHDLKHLAISLDSSVSDELKNRLELYSAYITWAGRYPLPSRPTGEKIKKFYGLSNDVLSKPTGEKYFGDIDQHTDSNAMDWDEFHKLWRSYADRYDHSK